MRRPDVPVAHVNPLPAVHCRMPEELLHDGIEKAIGAPLEPVGLETTVLAAMLDKPVSGTVDHPGADEAPVETTVCPLDDPVGFSNWTGTVVAANDLSATSNAKMLATDILIILIC